MDFSVDKLINSLKVRLNALQRLIEAYNKVVHDLYQELWGIFEKREFEPDQTEYGYPADQEWNLPLPSGSEDFPVFHRIGGYAYTILLVAFFNEFLYQIYMLSNMKRVMPTILNFQWLPFHKKILHIEKAFKFSFLELGIDFEIIKKLIVDRNYIVHRGGLWDDEYSQRIGTLPRESFIHDEKNIYISSIFMEKSHIAVIKTCEYICKKLLQSSYFQITQNNNEEY